MPDHNYRAAHEPPSRADHLFSHPFEHMAGVFNAVIGLILGITPFLTGPILGLHELHPGVYLALGALMVTGGSSILIGLQWPPETITRGWDIERIGWLLTAGAWATVAVILSLVTPILLFGLIVSGFLVVGAGLRIAALTLTERRVRAGVTELRKGRK